MAWNLLESFFWKWRKKERKRVEKLKGESEAELNRWLVPKQTKKKAKKKNLFWSGRRRRNWRREKSEMKNDWLKEEVISLGVRGGGNDGEGGFWKNERKKVEKKKKGGKNETKNEKKHLTIFKKKVLKSRRRTQSSSTSTQKKKKKVKGRKEGGFVKGGGFFVCLFDEKKSDQRHPPHTSLSLLHHPPSSSPSSSLPLFSFYLAFGGERTYNYFWIQISHKPKKNKWRMKKMENEWKMKKKNGKKKDPTSSSCFIISTPHPFSTSTNILPPIFVHPSSFNIFLQHLFASLINIINCGPGPVGGFFFTFRSFNTSFNFSFNFSFSL